MQNDFTIASMKTFIIVCFLVCGAAYAAPREPAEVVNSVNVLIDVSGSMKQNDPENLRISAVKLLINLLPEHTAAGIWVFAENTALLSQTKSVDQAWKKKALAATAKIHSRGLLTDIEKGIQTVLDQAPGAARNDNLILLTDGMVDISEDIMISADSRERVISEMIPVLQRRQIKVRTIALSEHADKELLDKLAFDTGGWSESAQSAERLQKAFLAMVNKALPRDTVPLRGNRFNIDSHVEEFSVLAFKKVGAVATRLTAPDGKQHSRDDPSDNMTWIADPHYDLITVHSPQVGEWTLMADIDPDDQVMVMTDLKLQLDELPNHIAVGEAVDVAVHFTDRGKLIDQDDFLRLLRISLQQTDALDRKSEWPLQPIADRSGYFGKTVAQTLDQGRHTLKIVADGQSFQRELVRTVDVLPAVVSIERRLSEGGDKLVLELMPDPELIEPQLVKAEALVNRADNAPATVDMDDGQGHWRIELELPNEGDRIVVNFDVVAKSLRGLPITPNIKPVVVDAQMVRALSGNTPAGRSVSAPVSEQPAASDAGAQTDGNVTDNAETSSQTPHNVAEKTAEQAEGGTDAGSWGIVTAMVAVANVALFGLGFCGYRYASKKAAEKHEKLLGRLT